MSKCFGILSNVLNVESIYIIDNCNKKNHILLEEKTCFDDIKKFTCEKCNYHYYKEIKKDEKNI